MHQLLKTLSLVTTTILLSLVSPVALAEATLPRVRAQATQDQKTEANRLLEQGIEQLNASQLETALQSLQQALAIYQEIQDRPGEGQVFKNLGNLYFLQQDYTQAIEYQQQALSVAREIEDRDLEARALLNIGLAQKGKLRILHGKVGLSITLIAAYRSLGEYQKAIELAQQLLIIAQEIENRDLEARTLVILAASYYDLDNYQKAIELAQQGLETAQEIENRDLEARTLVILAASYYDLDDYQKAIELAQQGLETAQEIENRDLEARTLVILAGSYYDLDDYQKAIEFTKEGLLIAQEARNRNLEANALGFLGFFYWALRDYQRGIDYAQQALAVYRELNDRSSELLALHNLNTNYLYLGDYQKVIELSQQELALAREIKNDDLEGAALVYLGFAYYTQGDFQKTIEYGQQALAVGREKESPIAEQQALLALSVGYSNLGDNEKALEYSLASLAIARDPKNRNRMWNNAEELALNITGSLYRKLGQKEEAISAYRETLAIDDGYFIARVGLARTYRELNMPVTAITYYKEAISSVEQIRSKILGLEQQLQDSFLQAFFVDVDRTQNTDIYRELADLLLSQGRILEAQEVLELLKIQELRDFTRNRSAGGEKPDVVFTQTEDKIKNEHGTLIAFGQKVVECEETSCSQLDGLLEQLDDLTEQFNQTLQAIETEVRDRVSQDPGTLDSEDFLREANDIVEAQPGTVLIYPLVLEDKIWLLWAAEGGIVKSVEVPNIGQRQLGETVLKFRQLLQNPRSDLAELQATGKQLYDWLLQPLEEELKSNEIQNLVFSLDRAARYIPMSALFDGEKYLIENYTISTVLSADLTNTDKRLPPGTENTSVLAMGLSEAVAGFNPLPNVPPELDVIVQTTENDPLGVYAGSQFLNQEFNLESLRKNLRGRQILHIATHGEFNPGRPEESYLVLGNGDKFAIPEISKLYRQLSDVHLVVLSACETALGGADADGNEINGISYYFLNHGAEAVMASLWLVNDASTSELMQQFYGNLARSSETEAITKSQALRQAQLSLLRGDAASQNEGDERTVAGVESRPGTETASANSTASGFSHPYYWAPFVLIGNGL